MGRRAKYTPKKSPRTCDKCFSGETYVQGTYLRKDGVLNRRVECSNCKHRWTTCEDRGHNRAKYGL